MFLLLLFTVGSCKKDLYVQETENKELQKNRIALLSQTQAELKKVNFSQFKSMVNQNSLGALKTELFLEENNLQQKTSSTKQTPAELSKYEVDKTSVNVLKAGGHTSYIFTIKQLYPRAITFRNLTIDESVNGTSAYITTYTPTKNWLKKRLANSNIKFEGKTEILPLDLKDPNLLQLRNNTNLLTGNGKISALKPTNKVSTIQYSCTTVTIYDIVAYSCKAGTHMPWDSGCAFTGADAASYGLVAGVPQTSCIEIEVPNNSGGNTTPIGPPNYNPCDETPKNPEENGNELPNGTIDQNPCDSITTNPLRKDTVMDSKFVQNAKAMCALNKLMQNNFYKNILNNFIGVNKPIDLTFKLNFIPQSPGYQTDANTIPNPALWNANNIDITLAENIINNLSSIEVATALLHEGIHAEIFRKLISVQGPGNLSNSNFPTLFNLYHLYTVNQGYQHEFIANYYVTLMSNALKQYDNNKFNIEYYEALAWSGLKGTTAYANLSSTKKAEMISKEASLLLNRSKTNCNDL